MSPPQHQQRSEFYFEDMLGVDGVRYSLSSLAGARAIAVVFTSNGCPTARAYEARLRVIQDRWRSHGVRLVAINPNNPYLSPADTLTAMAARSAERRWSFPYLKDSDGAIAKRYGAICTPHVFLLDREFRLVYSGRIDDSRTGQAVSRRDLETALSDLTGDRLVAVDRTEPFGCAIVW